MAAVIFVLGLCLAVSLAEDNSGTYNDVKSAYQHAFSGYDKNILPKPSPNVAVNVSLDMALIQLHEVDEEAGELNMVMWLGQTWHDPRLHWNRDHFHGTNMLAVPAEDIWTPDIAIFNSVKPPQDLFNAKVMVHCDGKVQYFPALRVRTTCPVDAKSENVTCIFMIGSWVHHNTNIDVYSSRLFEMTAFYTNPKWSAEYLGDEKSLKEYDCCPGNKYASVRFSVRITRK